MKDKITRYFILWLAFSALMVVLMILAGQYMTRPEFIPDQGALWYYWQNTQINQMGRVTGWGFFILHLLTTIYLVWKADKSKEQFGKWQKWLFGSQVIFILLHLIQTFFWYDALVYDTPVWLSQFSVIIMLVMMLIILNRKRGLFFGWKLPIPDNVTNFFINIHSYFIILALIFTFWYHPMETTVGHLIGFFYMFLLLGQVVFMNTKIHFNRYWVFLLEFTVLIHGTAIAVQNVDNPSLTEPKIMWPMFAFGFGMVTIITQIFLLKLSKPLLILSYLVYFALVLLVYSGTLFGVRTFSQVYEIALIPFIEYLLVLAFVGLVALWYKVRR